MSSRPPWEGEDITEFLINLEPFKHGIYGMPIKRITYAENRVEIEAFTQRELDSLWIDWDELGELE